MPEVAAVIKPSLDVDNPPIKDFSLPQWNLKCQELSTNANLIPRDVFALTGHYVSPNDGQAYRARLDDDSFKLEGGAINQICDIDSVLGVVHGHFPIADVITFKYFMLPSISHTLTANLHIPGIRVFGQDIEEQPIQIHKIPNARFAEMGDGFIVRIFFPELRHEMHESHTPNYVGEGRLKTFYDEAVQPAADLTMPENLVRLWPANYDTEMFRAGNRPRDAANPQDRRTTPQHTSRDVHAQHLNGWIDAIRTKVTEKHCLEFARGFFFLVEGKGTKNRDGIQHLPPNEDLVDDDGVMIDDENPRAKAVNHLLREFEPTLFPPGDWFLDIATTVSVEQDGHPVCVFASPDSHPEIIEHFSDTHIAQCDNFVRSNTGGYEKDEVAQIGVFAGFRIPFEDPGETGVCYLQVYSSEKSITYRVDAATKAKKTSLRKILENWQDEREKYFVPLQAAFTNASPTHSVALRFESRVRYESYPNVHHEIPLETLRPWLRYAKNTAFWGWKAKRLTALHNVLNRLMRARGSFTSHQLPEVGSLLVTLPWMVDALIQRPREGSHWNEVHDAASVHVQRGDRVVPDRPLVSFNLHSLRLSLEDDVLPRFSSHRTATKGTIIYLHQKPGERLTELQVWELIRGQTKGPAPRERDAWGVEEPSASQARLVPSQPNKQRKVNCRLASEVPDVFEGAIPEPQRPRGYDSEDDDPEEREAPMIASKKLADIVLNFPVQIFSKAPNRKRPNPSWCTLSPAERMGVTEKIFIQRREPLRVLSSYTDFGYNQVLWNKTVRVLFPTPEEHLRLLEPKIQGLHQLGVWSEWQMLLAEADKATAARMVKATRKRVNETWTWLPAFDKHHLWSTGTSNVKTAQFKGDDEGGPWIVRNPALRL